MTTSQTTQIVRVLPASDAAPELVRPAIDLAVGERIPGPMAARLRELAGAVLAPAVAGPADVVDLRVCADPGRVRLEVRWSAWWPSRAEAKMWARIHRLADRWGLAHHDDRFCLWAERFVERDPRRWPSLPHVSAA
jgi:hypothetical protein